MSDLSVKKSTIIEIALIRALVVVFQLVFLKVYSNYASAHELGIYYFLLTASYSLNAFLLVPLDYFQQSQLYGLKNDGFSLRSYWPINVFVIKLSLILLIFGNIICYLAEPQYCSTITIITLFSVSTYAVTLLRGVINNLEHRRAATYCLLLEYTLKIAFFYLYIQFYKPSSLLILGSLLSASIVSFFILLILFVKLTEYKFTAIKEFELANVFVFSYPISISAVINWIQTQSYSLILVPLGLAEVVGIYATVANVGQGGMNAYSTIFAQIFVPNIYKSKGSYIKVYLRNALLSVMFVLVCSALFSPTIITFLTKSEFAKYALVILFGVACEAGNFLIAALTIYLTLHNITKATLKMSVVGLITFLITFSLLYTLKFVSVYTIGIPMVATQMVIAIGLYITAQRAIKLKA
jgi:O-antigen/teichoic acid export membrane protein